MNKLDTNKICGIGILTALYCILASMINIPIIGAISLDLGYIALVIGCLKYHEWGAFIGAVGCGFESILFSPYGFSYSWFAANLIIGFICGYAFKNTLQTYKRVFIIVGSVALGVLFVKTFIECSLYGIPLEIKIVKNFVAFLLDAGTMIIGLLLYDRFIRSVI